jgi:hypothetical protein
MRAAGPGSSLRFQSLLEDNAKSLAKADRNFVAPACADNLFTAWHRRGVGS